MSEEKDQAKVSRRRFLEAGSAVLVATAGMQVAQGQQQTRSADHHLPNESQPVQHNTQLDDQNPNSVWSPVTDAGGQPPFKYPFSFAHKRIDSGGWTRQVTVRDFPMSKSMAGVQMRLISGGVRELHWHKGAEWAYMLYGSARITAVDQEGRSFVNDVNKGDLWIFPGGVPHSIQGLGPDGCEFLLVFDDGNFNEYETFLLTDWMAHTPKEVLAKNFGVPAETFDKVPPKELYIFATGLPRGLDEEKKQAEAGTGPVPNAFDFRPSEMKPNKISKGGEVKIVDQKIWPATSIAAAIVTVKPGGLRELHWHPNADEWQYHISGKARMTVFNAGAQARTMDFEEGDVGYINQSAPHYIENIGDTDLQFLEVFRTPFYEDISLAEWIAHTPARLVNEHIAVGEDFLSKLPRKEMIITPE
jgi:oxalate decarboxylase